MTELWGDLGQALAALQRELEQEREELGDEAATIRRRAASLEQQYHAVQLEEESSKSAARELERREAELAPEETRCVCFAHVTFLLECVGLSMSSWWMSNSVFVRRYPFVQPLDS